MAVSNRRIGDGAGAGGGAGRSLWPATASTYLLHQHYHAHVTQPILLAQVREWGIADLGGATEPPADRRP